MPSNEPDAEKEALIQAYVEGQLTPEESARLLEMVRHDSLLARVIVENLRMEGALREIARESEKETSAVRSPSTRRLRIVRLREPNRRGTLLPFIGVAAAACLLLLVGLALNSGPKPVPIARPKVEKPRIPEERPGPTSPQERFRPPEPPPTPVPAPEPPKAAPSPEPEKKPEKPIDPPRKPEEPRPPAKVEPPPLPAPPTVAAVAVATIDQAAGEVFVLKQGNRTPAKAPHPLQGDEALETTAAGRAVLSFPGDKTRVEVGINTLIGQVEVKGGKRVTLKQGSLRAEVSKQPTGQRTVFVTPHAEAIVLGTALRIVVDPTRTRLDVIEGNVRFMRKLDEKTVDVVGGHSAVAAAGVELAARLDLKVLLESEGAGIVVNFGPEPATQPGLKLPPEEFGCKVLNDSGQEFDPARGYGWTGPNPHIPGVWEDRNRLKDPLYSLRASFVYGGSATQTAEWRLSVPNGRYQVLVSVGTYAYEQGPHHVLIQGQLAFDRVMTRRAEFKESLVKVEVREGELMMVLGGHQQPKPSDDTVVNYILVKRMKD